MHQDYDPEQDVPGPPYGVPAPKKRRRWPWYVLAAALAAIGAVVASEP